MSTYIIEFLVESKEGNKIYEISELVTNVTYTDTLNNGCSKLDFSYIDDDLRIANGSIVRFKYNHANIFYGYVFKSKKGKGKEIQVTAYDQLRYLKAKDTLLIDDITLGALIKKACTRFNLKAGNIADTKYKLTTSAQEDKTWLDMFYDSVIDTSLGIKKKYCVRDEFGSIALRDLEDLRLKLIIGDESLCYDYNYEKSIDDNTYNQIKLVKENEKSGKLDVFVTRNSDSFGKWGILQYFEKVDKDMNEAQIKSKADALLGLYNREEESLELSCLGDTRVRAGCGILISINDLEITPTVTNNIVKGYLIVDKVTHEFLPVHTMDLELITYDRVD